MNAWATYSKKQKFQIISVIALVLGLPLAVGGVYTAKMIGSRAYSPATPPIVVTPPNSPPPSNGFSVSDSFSINGALNSSIWRMSGPRVGAAIIENEMLNMKLPVNTEVGQDLVVYPLVNSSIIGVSGDFSVSVWLAGITSQSGWQELRFQPDSTVSIRRVKGQSFDTIELWSGTSFALDTMSASFNLPADTVIVNAKIKRVGSTVSAYYSANSGDILMGTFNTPGYNTSTSPAPMMVINNSAPTQFETIANFDNYYGTFNQPLATMSPSMTPYPTIIPPPPTIKPSSTPVAMTVFSDNFDATYLDFNRWSGSSVGAYTIGIESGKLKMAVPQETSRIVNLTPMFNGTNLQFTGDFDGVVDLLNLTTENGSQELRFASKGSIAIKRVKVSGQEFIEVWVSSDYQNQPETRLVQQVIPLNSPQKVRLVRMGGSNRVEAQLYNSITGTYSLLNSLSGDSMQPYFSGNITLVTRNLSPNYPATSTYYDNFKLAYASASPTPVPTMRPTPSPTPLAKDLSINGSFESDSDNNRIPDAWNYNRLSSLIAGEGRVCDVSSDLRCSYKFNSSLYVAKKLYQELAYEGQANSKYSFSVNGTALDIKKLGAGSAYIKAYFYNSAGKQVFASKRVDFTKGTYEFKEFTLTGVAPFDYSRLKLEILFSTTGSLWVDSAKMTVASN